MRITVFGSTGRTGREIVKQALENGYEVTALVRSPEKFNELNFPSKNVKVVKGNVLNPQDVKKAVEESGAVISCLGVSPVARVPTTAAGTRNMVAAMEKFGVKRIVAESAYGAGYPRAGFYSWANRLIMPRIFKDKEEMEKILMESSVEFVIVRPSILTNGPKMGNYAYGTDSLPRGLFPLISRADVADFMLKQISSGEFVRKAVAISSRMR